MNKTPLILSILAFVFAAAVMSAPSQQSQASASAAVSSTSEDPNELYFGDNVDFDNVYNFGDGDDQLMFDDGVDDVQADVNMYDTGGLRLQHETVDEQADQPASGEEQRFVAVHVPQQGGIEQLRPDLVSLANMAIAYLPDAYRFDSVISAQREIVNGVRYTLLFGAAEAATGEAIVCETVVLERPWLLVGPFQQKQRELLHSNCTNGEVNAEAAAANAANDFSFNPLFVNQDSGLPDADLMRQLEGQIVAPAKPRATKKPLVPAKPTPPTVSDLDATALDEALRLIEKDILPLQRPGVGREQGFDVVDCPHPMNHQQAVDRSTADRLQQQLDDIVSVLHASEQAVRDKVATVADVGELETQAVQLTDTEKRVLDAFFGVDTVDGRTDGEERSTSTTSTSKTESTTSETAELAPESTTSTSTTTTTSTEASTPESQTPLSVAQPESTTPTTSTSTSAATESTTAVEVKPTTPATASSVDPLLDVRFGEPDDVADVVQLPTGQETELIGSTSTTAVNELTAPTRNEDPGHESPDCPTVNSAPGLVGGQQAMDPALAQQYSEDVLATAEAPSLLGHSFQQVLCATQQVVAGMLYTIQVEVVDGAGNAKQCQMKIWDRPWLKSSEVDVKCPGADQDKNLHVTLTRPAVEGEGNNSQRPTRSLLYDTHRSDSSSDVYTASASASASASATSTTTTTADDLLVAQQFTAFQQLYQRSYANATELRQRQRIFAANLQRIALFNRHERGSATYGVTQFADLTVEEFQRWTGLRRRPAPGAHNEVRHSAAVIPDVALPREFDWRQKGAITAVKNQGACGSCWAFSVTGNIEGLHAIRTGKLEEYSEQELVDCDAEDHGCEGGLPDNAYKAIEQLGGLETEQDYPYKAKQDKKCTYDADKVRVRISGAVDLPANETAMAQWVTATGPLSIGLNANAMQFYRGGVSHPWRALCAHSKIDHGVLIVGFGQSDYPLFNKTMPYWIVKNSWGPMWGEQGYYRVYRGDNTCGITSMVSSAVLADD